MANTLAENIRRNVANQAAVSQQFQKARERLPGYVAPPVTPAGMTPISELDKIREQVLKEQENDPFEMRLREEERLRDQTMPGTRGPGGGMQKSPGGPETTVWKGPPKPGLVGGTIASWDGYSQDPTFKGYWDSEFYTPNRDTGWQGNETPWSGYYDNMEVSGGSPTERGFFHQYLDSIGRSDLYAKPDVVTPNPGQTWKKGDDFRVIEPDTDRIDMTKPPGTPRFVDDSALTVMPQYKDPIPQDQLMAGFEEYVRNNPYSGFGTTAIVPVTLPGGYKHNFSGSQQANKFREYLASIGQHPYQRRTDENMIKRIDSPLDSTMARKFNQGGRVGLRFGTPEAGIESLDAGVIGEGITYSGNQGPKSPQEENMMMANVSNMRKKLFDMGYDWINDADDVTVRQIYDSEMGTWTDSSVWRPGSAQGGRIGYRFGPGPVAQGIPGIPRMAPDGMEYDMSQNGGFQPLGAREGKDDVKANLAKNEFVFTADAVRGAGGGDIELGAQKMYDTMKKLERRVG
jgi:hypothetical protein